MAAQCAVPLCASLLYLVHSALSARVDVGRSLLSSESIAKAIETAAVTEAVDAPDAIAPITTIDPTSSVNITTEGAATMPLTPAPKPRERLLWYDITRRNPKFAVPTATRLWETPLFLSHYHPSVRRFAESLQQAKNTCGKKGAKTVSITGPEYQGDPMRDFTLMSFLDRFSYRNPKKQKEQGKATMQPDQYRSDRAMQDPVNSKTFLMQNPKRVPVDEQFFYKFFVEKAKREARENAKLNKQKKKSVSDLVDNEGDVDGAGVSLGDNSDEEERFATMLAEKMMSDHTRSTGGVDFDPDDDFNPFSEDEDDEPDGDDDVDDEHDDGGEFGDSHEVDRTASVFATAEEFATMLEDAGEDKPDFEATRVRQQKFKRKYLDDRATAKKNKKSRKNADRSKKKKK